MVDFDYESYYRKREDKDTEYTRKAGYMKASHLFDFIRDEKIYDSIGEVGTGPGDVLNYFDKFRIKIGMDISLEGLQKQIDNYFKNKVEAKDLNIDFDKFYLKRISRGEIESNFLKRKPLIDGNLALIQVKPDSPLPFEDKSVDYLILCDIVEHVNKPIEFLTDMKRVGKKLLIKVPIEKALMWLLVCKLNGIKYGESHPSGHLYYWNVEDVFNMLNKSGIEIIDSRYFPYNIEFSQRKTFIKSILSKLIGLLDGIFPNKFFFSKLLLGGSLFIYAKEK